MVEKPWGFESPRSHFFSVYLRGKEPALTLKYDLTEGEKCKRILKIEVSSERVQEKFEETYRRLKTEAQLPGFRKGRVPMSTIKTRFQDVARKDVLED